jgi:hypothetical protein
MPHLATHPTIPSIRARHGGIQRRRFNYVASYGERKGIYFDPSSPKRHRRGRIRGRERIMHNY